MPPFKKTEFIWMNGEMLPWADATVHVSAHGLQYGAGVFEGMRSYDTPDGAAIFRLDAHLKRFYASAAAYELEIPFTIEELSEASLDVLRQNKLENSYLRPLAFFDEYTFSVSPKGSPVAVAVIAIPASAYFDASQGVRLTVSPIHRADPNVLPPTVKACGHYMVSIRAAQDAHRRGFDDAILLDNQGRVAEGSGANLLLVKDGKIVTADTESSILIGVTRDSILKIARDLGYEVTERKIAREELNTADEAFLCGTAVEVMPIREIDGHVFGDGKTGPVTQRIRQTFQDAVHGKLPQYREWLSYVNADATAGAR
jgi:branched-chain amino acid aminotransferase